MLRRLSAGPIRILLALAGSAVLLAGPVAAPAWADTELLQSYPEAESTVPQPVDQIRLSFADNLQASGNSVVVRGSDGTAYDDGPLRVVFDINVEQNVRPLPPGDYRVSWAVATGSDEVTRGEYSFTVIAAPTTTTQVVASASTWDGGGPVVLTIMGLAILVALVLRVLLIRKRYKRETRLPPYRPERY
jgi:copper resistance protein C